MKTAWCLLIFRTGVDRVRQWRWLIHVVFILLYVGITFFGLGPVLLADGSDQERWMTFGAVVIVYLLVTLLFRLVLQRWPR